jgi:hypothetical protein
MRFLTYITGFFMNFELLPILTDYANKIGKSSKFITNPVIYVKKLIIMLIIEISSNGQN